MDTYMHALGIHPADGAVTHFSAPLSACSVTKVQAGRLEPTDQCPPVTWPTAVLVRGVGPPVVLTWNHEDAAAGRARHSMLLRMATGAGRPHLPLMPAPPLPPVPPVMQWCISTNQFSLFADRMLAPFIVGQLRINLRSWSGECGRE